MDSPLSLIHNTFNISKIKPYIENDSTNFPGCQKEQPGEVTKGRREVEQVLLLVLAKANTWYVGKGI